MENSCRKKHTAATVVMADATEKDTVITETVKDAARAKEKGAATVRAMIAAKKKVKAVAMETVTAAAIRENNRPTYKNYGAEAAKASAPLFSIG